jgi:hypothetical protein
MMRVIFLAFTVMSTLASELQVTGIANEEFSKQAVEVELVAEYKASRHSRLCTTSNFPYRTRSSKRHYLTSRGPIRNNTFDVSINTSWGYNKHCKYRLSSIVMSFLKVAGRPLSTYVKSLTVYNDEKAPAHQELTFKCSNFVGPDDYNLNFKCNLQDKETDSVVKRLVVSPHQKTYFDFDLSTSLVLPPPAVGTPVVIDTEIDELHQIKIYENHIGQFNANSPVEYFGVMTSDQLVIRSFYRKAKGPKTIRITATGNYKMLEIYYSDDDDLMASSSLCREKGFNFRIKYFDSKNRQNNFTKCTVIKKFPL